MCIRDRFPNRDNHTPFDLMDVLRPQLGDRSRLEDDQGAFLDAVLLAKDHLWLFYNGFDVNDGEVREPSSIVQELTTHLAKIVKPSADLSERAIALALPFKQLGIAPQLASLYRIHSLQPFDVTGFTQQPALQRYQDHWYQVAKHIQQPQGTRLPWVNIDYQPPSQDLLLLDSQQWIADITFPARLYLKTLGVENWNEQALLDQDEPLFLDGLAKYAIRDFLHQHQADAASDLLLDQLPVSKIKHSAWQQSLFDQQRLQSRLHDYAMQETPTTYRTWRLSSPLHLNIQIPEDDVQDWVSVQASSARAKRIANVWLEYLIWLSFVNQDEHVQDKRRIVVFSDQTVICEGISSGQARQYLDEWLTAWHYARQQPLVLPAALILQPLEKAKHYHWEDTEIGFVLAEKDRENILKEWNKTGAFSALDVTQDESSKWHQDWMFILQQQDAQALLNVALIQFSYALYAPIFQYVRTE